MKRTTKKRLLKATAVVAFLIIALLVVRNGFVLVKIGDRQVDSSAVFPAAYQQKFINCVKGFPDHSVYEVTDEFVRGYLSFSFSNDIKNGKANCCGYAQLYANSYNAAIATYDPAVDSEAHAVVGYLTWYGINVNKLAVRIAPSKYKNFVKDHDYVEIHYRGERYYHDSSLNDLPFPLNLAFSWLWWVKCE